MAVNPRANAEMRTMFRAAGAVLLVAGIVLVVIGFSRFADAANSNNVLGSSNDPGFGSIFMIAGGGFLAVFGLAALRMGFLRAELNYVVGEGSDAIQSVAADVATGLRVARPEVKGSGRFCSQCGAQHAEGARFCDACGTALA